jgi:hypothetical protein
MQNRDEFIENTLFVWHSPKAPINSKTSARYAVRMKCLIKRPYQRY